MKACPVDWLTTHIFKEVKVVTVFIALTMSSCSKRCKKYRFIKRGLESITLPNFDTDHDSEEAEDSSVAGVAWMPIIFKLWRRKPVWKTAHTLPSIITWLMLLTISSRKSPKCELKRFNLIMKKWFQITSKKYFKQIYSEY